MIQDRATLVEGYSPVALAEAYRRASRSFDLVLIDGDHSAEGVYRDTAGVVPFLSQGAFLVFHDSHYPDVADGIDRFVQERSGSVVDMGTLTREATRDNSDASVHWGGLRLMRVFR